MQNFGNKPISDTQSAVFDVGNNWEYVRITNESGYDLNVSMNAIGNENVPAWHLLDIPCILNGSMRPVGQVQISAQNLSDISNTQFPSSFVNVVCYLPGELPRPFSVALTRLVSTQILTVPFVNNTGFAGGQIVVFAEPVGDSSTQGAVNINNLGQMSLGDSLHNGSLALLATSGADMVLQPTGVTMFSASGPQVFQVDQNGTIILNVPNVQTLVNGSTITLPGTFIRVNNAGAVTGIIMTPGSQQGQLALLYNIGPGSLTFAAAGSNVRGGAGSVLSNGHQAVMIFEGTQWSYNGS